MQYALTLMFQLNLPKPAKSKKKINGTNVTDHSTLSMLSVTSALAQSKMAE
jgi:hypothetical protein